MSNPTKLIIGSRGSNLALWQANYVQASLQKHGIDTEIKIIKTQGDKIQHLGFDKMEGKGFFTKEIEEQLLDGSIDIAVHSHKDLETSQPDGLCIAGVSYRESPEDVLLINKKFYDPTEPYGLKPDAHIGTSSARRKSQVLNLFPMAEIRDLRGNVPTRIEKLRDGQYHGILLANAGLKRLELDVSDLEVIVLPVDKFVPAPAQGVLAYQSRVDDTRAIEAIKHIADPNTSKSIDIERGVLRLLNGGCHVPLGVYVNAISDTEIDIYGAYAKADINAAEIKHYKGPLKSNFEAFFLDYVCK